jgi:hypothetical protein
MVVFSAPVAADGVVFSVVAVNGDIEILIQTIKRVALAASVFSLVQIDDIAIESAFETFKARPVALGVDAHTVAGAAGSIAAERADIPLFIGGLQILSKAALDLSGCVFSCHSVDLPFVIAICARV